MDVGNNGKIPGNISNYCTMWVIYFLHVWICRYRYNEVESVEEVDVVS